MASAEEAQAGPAHAATGDGGAGGAGGAAATLSSRPPDAAGEDTAGGRGTAWLVVALALIWLIFLVYPLITAVGTGAGPAWFLIPTAGSVLFLTLYVWGVARVAFASKQRAPWVEMTVLTGLALALPLAYGAAWFGGSVYAAIVAGLTLPVKKALAATAVLAALAIATGSVAGAPWWHIVAVALLTGTGGGVMCGLMRLLATNRELRAARAEIARLAAGEERLRLARDLHDAVKQQAFVTAMEIGAVRALWDRDPRGAKAHLGEADAANRRVQAELDALIHESRPAPLQDRGLTAALRDYLAGWSRRSGIRVDLRVWGASESESAPGVEQALWRVAQEALANVAKHSGATAAMVSLEWGCGALTLCVRDNGHGFVPADAAGPGYGLPGMRARVEELRGRLEVQSAPGEGTRVTCVCPLDSNSTRGRRRRQWASR